MSLRGRIRLLAVGAAVSVLVLFAIPLWVLEVRAVTDDVVQSATDTARGVADYLSAEGVDGDLAAYVRRINDREDVSPVAVLTPDGTTYGPAVPGAEDHEPREGDGDSDRDGPFLSQSAADVDNVSGGTLVTVEVRTTGGPTEVLAFASDEQVGAAVATRLLPLGAAAVVLLLLVAAAADVVARRLARDIDRTADLADALSAGDVTARVPETGSPEVRRVALALNGLAGRIDELLAAERETVADLSHRLRTPLMALRLDVEALPDSESRRDLDEHVTTLERTLTAVIHQARRTDREGPRVGCLPGPVVQGSADYWQPLIEDQGRPFSVSLDVDLPEVHCSADDLRAAIDALVENAIAHTPDRTPIAVSGALDRATGRVLVEVRDGGGGFDDDAVHRGRSDRGSTGLGLDIARRCAHASGGELRVGRRHDEGADWTVVTLELGLTAHPRPSTI